ncbi:hypothetical protein SAMN05443252_106194 [Bacillus sp. OV322]|uniref:hypothetical protein n=1 Tax=Bacillus sp. OV322 TaxID=1882764 RepID=UPI0008EC872B|nr:hypothetical protein [Bacillus sp. OV322]SFC79187.1 hypothetical protein SAMN05443252_106194 [Bacillus sp. OV322]
MAEAKRVGPYVWLGVGIAGASLLLSKSRRDKAVSFYRDIKDKAVSLWSRQQPPVPDVLQKSGHPDPYDTGDNKMVDEGAMYSVNYYNEKVHH